jgi:hypothetical protein
MQFDGSQTLKLAMAARSGRKYWVQMHGSFQGDTFRVPPHVVVVFTTPPGGYGVGSMGLSLPSPVLRSVGDEARVLNALLLQHHDTYSATYVGGMTAPDLDLEFDYGAINS